MRLFRFLLTRRGDARRRLLLSLLVGAVSGLLSVALLALIHRTLARPGAAPVVVALLFALLCAAATRFRVLAIYLLSSMGQGLVRDLRLELARRVLATPLPRLEELGSPRILACLTEDVAAMTQALAVVPAVAINGIVVAGALGYLAWLDGRLFLLLLAAVLVGTVTYQIPAQLGLARFRRAREQEDELFGHFRALTEGVKELKLHRARQEAFTDQVAGTAGRLRDLRVGAALLYGTAGAWGHLLFFVVIGVLLFLRPGWVASSPEALVGYTLVLLYMMTPLQTVLDSFPILGRADVAVERLQRLGLVLAAEAAPPAVPPGSAPARSFDRLELLGITHTYRREGRHESFTLGPLDLRLAPGELVFLVGGNGSGKTTLAKVLVGLYAPAAGEIRLDGRVIGDGEREGYRQLFTVVFSDFYLFERLLGLGGPEREDDARRYLEALELGHKVRIEGGAFTTTELSQGQRKRLALLTAYLEDRPVYVFDEWAADQDPVFKEVFYRQILPDLAARGKAVVAISHDDRYFGVADRVLKLVDGQLEELPVAPLATAPR